MEKFVPRDISPELAAQGYNNEGRGGLIGYIALVDDHEKGCPYRENPRSATCACRIGLWLDKPVVKRTKSKTSRKTKKSKAALKTKKRRPSKKRLSK